MCSEGIELKKFSLIRSAFPQKFTYSFRCLRELLLIIHNPFGPSLLLGISDCQRKINYYHYERIKCISR